MSDVEVTIGARDDGFSATIDTMSKKARNLSESMRRQQAVLEGGQAQLARYRIESQKFNDQEKQALLQQAEILEKAQAAKQAQVEAVRAAAEERKRQERQARELVAQRRHEERLASDEKTRALRVQAEEQRRLAREAANLQRQQIANEAASSNRASAAFSRVGVVAAGCSGGR